MTRLHKLSAIGIGIWLGACGGTQTARVNVDALARRTLSCMLRRPGGPAHTSQAQLRATARREYQSWTEYVFRVDGVEIDEVVCEVNEEFALCAASAGDDCTVTERIPRPEQR